MAAVVVIEWNENLLFIRRQERKKDPWSGHFSFPGGRAESKDKNLVTTACREVKEEVGLDLDVQKITCPIEPLKTQFEGMVVQPFYINLKKEPKTNRDKEEVRYVRWVPLSLVIDPSVRKSQQLNAYYPSKKHSCIPLDDYYIWGVTLEIIDKMFIKEECHLF